MSSYPIRQVLIIFLLVGVSLTHAVCHAALDDLPFIGDKLPFSVRIENNRALAKSVEEALRKQREESAEFENINRLRRAARFDREVILSWLRSEGYFAATLDSNVEDERIIHRVVPGSQYIVRSLAFDFPSEIAPPEPGSLSIIEGKPLRAADVLTARKELTQYVLDKFCLYQVEISYTAEVNHTAHTAFVTYVLVPSPSVKFGSVHLAEMTSLDAKYLRNYFAFTEGECFKRKALDQTRLDLLQTNLLSRVEVQIAEPKDGLVDVTFAVTERNHRTLKAGLGYDSNQGPGLMLGWEHRNLFHSGEHLEVETRFAEIERSVTGEVTVPHFRRKGQTLSLLSKLSHEIPQAYESTSAEIGAALSRELRRHWAASVGTSLEISRMIENEQKDDFGLMYFPLSLDYIRTNDLLDPNKGLALGIKTVPFVDLYNTGTRFVKTTLAASVYLTERDWWAQPTLALRAATGTITGVDLEAIPAAHRYYVGGGGSVRGYAYQKAGELTDGEPDGGLSFGETSIELRLRVAESWGLVLFTDGGYAYPGESPDFGQDFLWGAGLGLRYFTSFAPIRLDVATPLEKRTNAEGAAVDNSVQIYISIGQAF